MKTKYATSIVKGRILRLQREAEQAALREANQKPTTKKKVVKKKAAVKKIKID